MVLCCFLHILKMNYPVCVTFKLNYPVCGATSTLLHLKHEYESENV